MPATAVQPDTLEALQIYVNRGRDGDGYEVDYLSRRWLQQALPGVRAVRQIYIGHETRRDLEPQLEQLWEQVVTLLTGVSPARLAELGVSRVSFLDPATNQEFEGYSTHS